MYTMNHEDRDATRTKIYKYISDGIILEIYDMLSVEPRHNKIAFTLVCMDSQKHHMNRVRHYVDVDDIKLVCLDLLFNKFVEFRDYKGSKYSDYSEARTLTVLKSKQTSTNIVLQIDNGVGDVH